MTRAAHPGRALSRQEKSILRLLRGANGGMVTYRLIEHELRRIRPLPPKWSYLLSGLRIKTGLGIVHHSGAGYRLEPSLDADWTKKNPA